MPAPAATSVRKVVAENRKARFSYFIEETFEAGIALTGSEVKSLRMGRANIAESYATEERGEVYLINAYIPEYLQANRLNHETRRPRKLLLHKREVGKLIGAVQREGMTLVPLRIYFNDRGRAKLELALAARRKRAATGSGRRAASCVSAADGAGGPLITN
jgi:SsrA-binding protein